MGLQEEQGVVTTSGDAAHAEMVKKLNPKQLYSFTWL